MKLEAVRVAIALAMLAESSTGDEAAAKAVLIYYVEPNGRVRDCRIARSSGLPDLDALACSLVVERARFEPALDESGLPISAQVAQVEHWGFGSP